MIGLPECWGIACVCPGPGALIPFAFKLEGAVELVGCCGRSFCLGLGRTMGSACGLRFIGPNPPVGVCPGVRPGVRPAGEALIMTMYAEVEKVIGACRTSMVRGVRGVENGRGRCDWSAVAGRLNHGFVQEYHNNEHVNGHGKEHLQEGCMLWM